MIERGDELLDSITNHTIRISQITRVADHIDLQVGYHQYGFFALSSIMLLGSLLIIFLLYCYCKHGKSIRKSKSKQGEIQIKIEQSSTRQTEAQIELEELFDKQMEQIETHLDTQSDFISLNVENKIKEVDMLTEKLGQGVRLEDFQELVSTLETAREIRKAGKRSKRSKRLYPELSEGEGPKTPMEEPSAPPQSEVSDNDEMSNDEEN